MTDDPIRDAAIEAAVTVWYDDAEPWETRSNAVRDLWREDVIPVVDAVLAVAGPAYRAEALRDAARDPALRLSGHSGVSIRRLRDRAEEQS